MPPWRRTSACERAAHWISLRLDNELSELEGVVLDRHVGQCARCQAVSGELTAITHLLREAPLVELEREPVVMSRRRATRKRIGGMGVAAALASAAAAAVALLVSGSVANETQSSAFVFRSVQEQVRFVHHEQAKMEPVEYVPVVSVAARYAARSL
jgi:ferric-dicitrate binding protein FerR (iron transport regulator)